MTTVDWEATSSALNLYNQATDKMWLQCVQKDARTYLEAKPVTMMMRVSAFFGINWKLAGVFSFFKEHLDLQQIRPHQVEQAVKHLQEKVQRYNERRFLFTVDIDDAARALDKVLKNIETLKDALVRCKIEQESTLMWLHKFPPDEVDDTIEKALKHAKLLEPSSNPQLQVRCQTIKKIYARYAQLKALKDFEIEALPTKDCLQLAYSIEVVVPAISDVGNGVFLAAHPNKKINNTHRHSPPPPRDILITQKRRVIVMANFSKTKIYGKGSNKEVFSAVKLYEGMRRVGKGGVIKTQKMLAQAVIPYYYNDTATILREFAYFERFKKIPGIAALRTWIDISGTKAHNTDYTLNLRESIPSHETGYIIALFDSYQGYLSPKKFSLSDEDIKKIALDTTRALAAIHDKGVVHGDIKIGNLLFRREKDGTGSTGVTDFDCAFENRSGVKNPMGIDGFYGTWPMIPPEMLEYTYEVGNILYKAEVWALGVCLYILHFKQEPSWCKDLTPLVQMLIDIENFRFQAKRRKLSSAQRASLRKLTDDSKNQIASVKQQVTATIEDRFAAIKKKAHFTYSEKIEFLIYSMMRQDPDERITMQQAHKLSQHL